MKSFHALTSASVLFLSACASPPQSEPDARETAAQSSTLSVHDYRCESGETISATYPTADSSTVRYKGSAHDMRSAVSGSGSRYVGRELEWWTKGSGPGSEGTLFRRMADGTSGDLVESCSES